MSDFILSLPKPIFLGNNTLSRIPAIALEAGSRALVVTEAALKTSAQVAKILELLDSRGIDAILYDDAQNLTMSSAIDKIVSLARGSRSQMIICVGGEATLRGGRVAGVAASYSLGLDDLVRGQKKTGDVLPVLLVPSTFHTPELFTENAAFYHSMTRKMEVCSLANEQCLGVFFDTGFAGKIQLPMAGIYGMSALCFSFEALISRRVSRLAKGIILQGVELYGKELVAVARDTGVGTEACVEANTLLALGMATSEPSYGAALSRGLSTVSKIPAPVVSALLFPHLIELYGPDHPADVEAFARALGEETSGLSAKEITDSLSGWIRRLMGLLKLPGRLSELGADLDKFGEAVEQAFQLDIIPPSGTSINEEEAYTILKLTY